MRKNENIIIRFIKDLLTPNRCHLCDGKIVYIGKIKKSVWESTYFKCNNCGQEYWNWKKYFKIKDKKN